MDDSDYSALASYLYRHHGLDLNSYKSAQVKRRLESYLSRARVHNWAEFMAKLEREPEETLRLRDFLTITVTSFYRDVEKFRVFAREIVPSLLDPSRTLRVWSAGCSDGAEPYTLAMLFDSIAPRQKVHIWATDIDHKALATARAGGPYRRDAVQLLPSDLASRYLEEEQRGLRVVPELMGRVTVEEHNLLRGAVRERFDLIVCRNVLIYFTDEAKSALFERFVSYLRPRGVLFIGAAESIPLRQARRLGLEAIEASFYQLHAEPKPMDDDLAGLSWL